LSRFEQQHVSYPKAHFVKAKDNRWTTKDVVAAESKVDASIRTDFIAAIKTSKAEKDQIHKVEAARAAVQLDDWYHYDPFKPVAPHTMKGNQRTRDIHHDQETNRVDSIPGFRDPITHFPDSHADPGHNRVHKLEHVPVARYDPIHEQVALDQQHDATAHAHRDYLNMQRMAKKKDRDEARHAERFKDEAPIVAAFGTAGSGAPNRHEDGTIMTALTSNIEKYDKVPINIKYGRALATQIKEIEVKQHGDNAYDTHASLHAKTDKWDPFSRAQIQSDTDRKRQGFHTDENREFKENLLTTMGKPGGGTALQLGNLKRAENMPDEEFRTEDKAQREGASQWGKPGCGAPNRNPDGSTRTKQCAAAEAAKNGLVDRTEPDYKRRIAKIREDQAAFMKQKQVNIKQEKTAEKVQNKRYISEPTMNDFMASTSDRRHKKEDISKNHQKDPDPNFDPMGPGYKSRGAIKREVETGKIIIRLREEKQKREIAEKKLGHELDAMHIKRMNEVTHATHQEDMDHMLAPKHKDLTLTGGLRPELNVAAHRTTEEKAAFKDVLVKDISERKVSKKKFKERKLKDEEAHGRHANKFLASKGPPLKRQVNGQLTARRHIPADPAAREYRLMAVPSSSLQ
jgi:hypothetical protein